MVANSRDELTPRVKASGELRRAARFPNAGLRLDMGSEGGG